MPSRLRSLILVSFILVFLVLVFSDSTVFDWVAWGLSTFLEVHVVPLLGPVVLLLAAAFLVWFIRSALWTRRETFMAFEDLSADPVKRQDANRVLTCLVLSQLQDPQPLRMSELQMDIMPGAEEPGFGGLRPQQPMEAIPGFVPADHPVKIATVEFNLSDILNYFRRLFDRPYEQYLQGWLLESNGDVTAVAQLLDSAGRLKRRLGRDQMWRVQIAGANARERAIADLAAQIMVGMGKSNITGSWQSLRSFQAGMHQLHLGRGLERCPVSVESARHHFEDALDYDPSNWIVRFQLALVLCGESWPRAALEHFQILQSVFEQVLSQETGWWSRSFAEIKSFGRKLISRVRYRNQEDPCLGNHAAFRSVLRHLQRYPECPFLVEYNRAITLSTLPDVSDKQKAIEVLKRLSNLGDVADSFRAFNSCAKRLSDRSKTELELYAKSAQARILSSLDAASDRIREDRIAEVNVLWDQIKKLCLQKQERNWRSLQTGRAVTLAARARLLAAKGEAKEACSDLYQALAAEPKFVQAYTQIAELHLKEKEKLSQDWAALAEFWLRRAKEINPACRHTQMLLENLHQEQEPSLQPTTHRRAAATRQSSPHADLNGGNH